MGIQQQLFEYRNEFSPKILTHRFLHKLLTRCSTFDLFSISQNWLFYLMYDRFKCKRAFAFALIKEIKMQYLRSIRILLFQKFFRKKFYRTKKGMQHRFTFPLSEYQLFE